MPGKRTQHPPAFSAEKVAEYTAATGVIPGAALKDDFYTFRGTQTVYARGKIRIELTDDSLNVYRKVGNSGNSGLERIAFAARGIPPELVLGEIRSSLEEFAESGKLVNPFEKYFRGLQLIAGRLNSIYEYSFFKKGVKAYRDGLKIDDLADMERQKDGSIVMLFDGEKFPGKTRRGRVMPSFPGEIIVVIDSSKGLKIHQLMERYTTPTYVIPFLSILGDQVGSYKRNYTFTGNSLHEVLGNGMGVVIRSAWHFANTFLGERTGVAPAPKVIRATAQRTIEHLDLSEYPLMPIPRSQTAPIDQSLRRPDKPPLKLRGPEGVFS